MFDGMREIAARKQWVLQPPEPSAGEALMGQIVVLTGSEDGITVRLDRCAFTHSFVTNAFLEPPMPWSFLITHQSVVGSLAGLVGFRDIEVGDPAFDNAFRVVSKDSARTTAVLVPEARAALEKLDASTKSFGARFQVSESAATVTRTYLGPMTSDEVWADVPNVVAVVKALARARAPNAPPYRAPA